MYTSEDIEVQLKKRGIVILSRPSTSQSQLRDGKESRGGSRSGDRKRSGVSETSREAEVQGADEKDGAQATSEKGAEGAEEEEVDEEELERRAILAKELGARLSEDELREVRVLCVVIILGCAFGFGLPQNYSAHPVGRRRLQHDARARVGSNRKADQT